MRADRQTGAFSPVVMIVLVLVGVISLAGIGLLAAYEPELRSGDNGREHALSRSAIGFAAIARLLQDTGARVVLSRGPLSPAAEDGLLVLTPAVMTNPRRLAEFEHVGPTLVVLPKWRAGPDPLRRGWVRSDGVLDIADVGRPAPKGLTLARRSKTSAVQLSRPSGAPFANLPRVEELQTLSGADWEPVLRDETGAIVLAMRRDQSLYVLSDPDLLNTQGMKSLAGAQAGVKLLQLIRAEDTPVVFDLTLHGFERSLNPLRLILEPPLLGATLCLLLALALAGAHAAVRFGPTRTSGRVVALGKRALADNTAGLVRLARREHRMAMPYAELIRSETARAIGAPRGLEGDELNPVLDRLGATVGVTRPFSILAERARAARNTDDLMQVARELYRWRLEMTRERR